MILDFIRGVIRPLVTVLFVSGFLYMALTGIDPPEAYMVMTGMILAFYFKDRDDAKNKANSGN